MNQEPKKCSKCGKRLRSHCVTGKCWDKRACAARAGGVAPAAETQTPPKRVRREKPPRGAMEDFFELATALGLDPQHMLDGHCRKWVEKVRARALGRGPTESNGAAPVLDIPVSNGARTEVAES